MSTLEFLQNRTSIPARLLDDPAPDVSQLKEILKAAVAAPDHCTLRPWEFIIISGEARNALGEVFVNATQSREPDMPAEKIEQQRVKPLRAPMIIAVVANILENFNKAPEIEQVLSAGAAAQQIQLAANALGFGSIWLTGPNAEDPLVKEALGIPKKNQIVGFIYIGTSTIKKPQINRPDPDEFTRHWTG